MGMTNLVPLPMSDHSFLVTIRALAVDTAKVKISRHASQRMVERKITMTQILACLRRGSIYEAAHQDIRGDWKATLRHVWAGDDVRVAVALKKNSQGEVIAVITVF